MSFQPANPVSVVAFCLIVVFVIAAFLGSIYWVYRGDRARARAVTARAAISLAIWLGIVSLLVGSGILPSLPLNGIPFFFGAVLISALILGLSSLGGTIAAQLPLKALVGFQAFRLPLEWVLHSWADQGTIPTTMTWSGQNWDVITGVVALVAFPFADRSRAVAWCANLVGFILLVNVMRVALLSSPVPFGWNDTPPLQLAFHLPYALIGPVCVAGALAGHIILTRRLLTRRQNGIAPARARLR